MSMITMHLFWIVVVFGVMAFLMFIVFYWIIKHLLGVRHNLQHKNYRDNSLDTSVAFFHPYCNAGGGGERVLWCAVKSIQEKFPNVRIIIYTGDIDSSESTILDKAKERFNITLDRRIEFIFLTQRRFVEARIYPYFTLLGQSFGSIILGVEALFKFVPTVYLDTMGYAFTLPLFKYFGSCRVGCYVHYPTISSDMLNVVASRSSNLTNTGTIARNPVLSQFKLIYYRIFAIFYGLVGKTSEVTMVNSSWTKMHILQLWRRPDKTFCVYPPCDVSAFEKIPIDNEKKEFKTIVSVAQFRPEKDHSLQIRAFNKFLTTVDESERNTYKLVLVGSCRDQADEKRVIKLMKLCEELNIKRFVEFKMNLTFGELKNELEKATIGLHSMWNEHFGIGVVECLAAGLLVLAHDSGGPKMDIVVQYNGLPTGFLASDVDSFAEQMTTIFELNTMESLKIRLNARVSVKRFSDKEFTNGFLKCVKLLLPSSPN